ncbi:T9SS C-terminal target domain-containing protein [Sphingobacteriales bacterium UPWRP_1]|nr:hypothetical protein B6N25_10810 [Sphingobacteriales bacterium TSM_CSS]PSJ75631.1 T9SS C-terminal target domain-containing protein [Sphingobacteriales bacterium UPWRP_1]
MLPLVATQNFTRSFFTLYFIHYFLILSIAGFSMKTNSLLSIVALFFVCYIFSASKDPSNPPAGKTGAPGETTCAQSSCHNGGSFTGTVSISGIPDTVAPNQTYTITLTHNSNASRAGFQITCLNESNNACGTFTAGSGSSKTTSNSRQYVRQSSPKTLSGGTASWSFTWQAPATLAGNTNITFYFSSLAANGNGAKTGDNVLLGTHTTILYQEPAVGIEPNEPNETQIALYPTPATETLYLTMPYAQGTISLYNMQGQCLLTAPVTAHSQLQVGNLPKGMYIAKIKTAQTQLSRKIILE